MVIKRGFMIHALTGDYINFRGLFTLLGERDVNGAESLIEILAEKKRVSMEQGYEILDEMFNFSFNFRLKGQRVYFTSKADVARYIRMLEDSGYGRSMSKYDTPVSRRKREFFKADGCEPVCTFLPISIREIKKA